MIEENKNATYKDFKIFTMDIFSGSLYHPKKRFLLWGKTFSHFGNPTDTPDIMLKRGDAIEIKSIIKESKSFHGKSVDGILLNNVPPMQFIQKNNPLIAKKCVESGDWGRTYQRDVIYVVGIIEKNLLRGLSMVYGRDYCASNEYYSNIRKGIKRLYENKKMIENNSKTIIRNNLESSKELARIDNFDPLGLTQARFYAHWYIKTPWQAFDYVYRRSPNTKFDFMCIINEDKWKTLENRGLLTESEKSCQNLRISPIRIKNPDNPEECRDAVLITYEIPKI